MRRSVWGPAAAGPHTCIFCIFDTHLPFSPHRRIRPTGHAGHCGGDGGEYRRAPTGCRANQGFLGVDASTPSLARRARLYEYGPAGPTDYRKASFMTTPDPQVTPSFSEDPTKAAASDATPGASAAPGMPANNATADIPAPQVPGPDAPSFPQASAPDFDESMATPGTTTYGTAYDSASAGDANGAQAGYDQAAYGAQAGYGQPGYDQAAYGAQASYGQPGYDQAAYGAQASYGQAYAGPPKQWIIAVLLAFFLGTLGIHNFYLGYTTRGIIQLVLTLTFIGAIVSAVWAFIEFILILMRSGSYAYDAQGRPLE